MLTNFIDYQFCCLLRKIEDCVLVYSTGLMNILYTQCHSSDKQNLKLVVDHAILTFRPIGQSPYPYPSTDPFDSVSAAVYNLGPDGRLQKFGFSSSDGKNPWNNVLSEWGCGEKLSFLLYHKRRPFSCKLSFPSRSSMLQGTLLRLLRGVV